MAKLIFRWNVQVEQIEKLNEQSARLGISKSEIVNRAFRFAINDMKTVVNTLIDHNGTPSKSNPKASSFMMALPEYNGALSTAEKLYLSKDHFLRIALDYYLNHVIK